MIDFINQHEPVLRALIFAGSLGLLAVFEVLFPRRFLGARLARWRTNFLLGGANMFLLRIVLPGGLVALAFSAYGSGVFGRFDMPLWAEILISLVILDFIIYAQHVALHRIAFLWPLHAAHHAEQTLDVSSGLRFHPGEALVSLGVKALAVLALGIHPVTIIIFEILLSSASLFTHSNLDLGRWDARLQEFFVSPDMHRRHHSRGFRRSAIPRHRTHRRASPRHWLVATRQNSRDVHLLKSRLNGHTRMQIAQSLFNLAQ